MDEVVLGAGAVEGVIDAPTSKSMTHRAYVLAARAGAPTVVLRPLRARDTDATLQALRALGAEMDVQDHAVEVRKGMDLDARQPALLDCANAGTALRLLLGQAATLDRPCTLDGDVSLRTRPHGELLDALRILGAKVDDRDGRAPVTVRGPIHAGSVSFPGTSSQFASALLLSLPFLDGDSRVELTAPRSLPYLDITLRVATAFGLRIERPAPTVFDVPGGQVARPVRFVVEGDWSGAAFSLAAGAIGGKVTVRGLPIDSTQGDRAIVDILTAFGADLRQARANDTQDVTATRADLASPGTIDVSDTPDLFPVLAAVAACAEGTTTFTGGATLRDKECDRIAAMAQGLAALGIEVRETRDGLVVMGRPDGPRGGRVHAHEDHRIHMAFSVLALAAKGPVTIDGLGCEAVSYPGFHADLRTLQEGA